jgi:phosphohistidine phosphatase
MELLILRHADAVFDAPSDFDRALSEKGVRQAHEVAAFLKVNDCVPDILLSSPAVRARSTAEVIALELKVELIECPWALPGMYSEDAIQQLSAFSHFNRVLLVGHQPDLAELTAKLLCMPNADRLHVRKATMIHLKMLGKAGATLEAFIPCRLM